MNKAKMNYWVDLVIALAFVLSAISGVVFLFPMSVNSTVLGVSHRVWNQIHVWGSLLMIAGVLAHLLLHWKWIVVMTKRTFLPQGKPPHAGSRPAATNAQAFAGRRHFLRAAGVSTVALGAAAIGYRSLFGSQATASQAVADAEVLESMIPMAATPTTASASAPQVVQPAATTVPVIELSTENTAATELILVPTSTSAATATAAPTATTVQQTQQKLTVACPKGLTYDAYPGRCRHYVDRDGDGYCDYSIPTVG